MKTMIKYIAMYAVGLGLLSSCSSPSSQQTTEEEAGAAQTGHEEGKHAKGEHEEGLVTMTAQQREAVGLELGTLQQKNLSGTIKANGELELPPQNEASVSARVGGNVYKINVIEGDKVKKGEVLALLEHPDLVQMQTDLQGASNRLQYLEQEYQRQKRLYENEVGSGKEFQQITSEYHSAKSKVEGLKTKLSIINLNADKILAGQVYRFVPVVSPIEGYIKYVNIKTGAYVSPQEVMFDVVNNDHIHADLMVFEKDIFKVKEGQKVRFTVANVPDKEMTATIYSVGKAFESDPKALHVHAEIDSKENNLLPGMYVQGRILVEDYQTLALPEHAVVTEGQKSYIFVKTTGQEGHEEELSQGAHRTAAASVTAGETEIEEQENSSEDSVNQDQETWTFKQVEVVTGVKDNGFVEVKPLEPLSEKATVAYNAAYFLLSEMQKGEAEHSH